MNRKSPHNASNRLYSFVPVFRWGCIHSDCIQYSIDRGTIIEQFKRKSKIVEMHVCAYALLRMQTPLLLPHRLCVRASKQTGKIKSTKRRDLLMELRCFVSHRTRLHKTDATVQITFHAQSSTHIRVSLWAYGIKDRSAYNCAA